MSYRYRTTEAQIRRAKLKANIAAILLGIALLGVISFAYVVATSPSPGT